MQLSTLFHHSGTFPWFRGSLLMWCKKKSQWLLCIWKMASLHWNPQHHLLNSPIQIGKGSSSSKHTLFSSTLAPGKSGGKALALQLRVQRGLYTGADTSLVIWLGCSNRCSQHRVLNQILPPLEARVSLKRTLLSVHVFFHNWMCWSPKLLFLPKLLHDSCNFSITLALMLLEG